MSNFTIREHIVRCQHTRERAAGAERGRQKDLRLHVKQYIPKSNPKPKSGDVTIIGAHANGFPKECYEPFWDDLLEAIERRGRGVRGIWIADIASQGQSGVLNEALLGPDASWWDHGRDLLFLINQFQDEIPHPIVGVGHSVGASHLAHLSLLHPRLLHSLVFVDPIMQQDILPHKKFARLSTNRRDVWPSRAIAAEKFRASKFYQQWDPRVLDKWIEYGLRDLPTEQYPDLPESTDAKDPPVTLTTTVAQEVYFYMRPYYPEPRLLQDEDSGGDVDANAATEDFPFDMPEGRQLYDRLPELRPSTLFVFGSQSEASSPQSQAEKLARTGVGLGGSGGVEKGKVSAKVLDCGHLVAMERTTESADAAGDFLAAELRRWDDREKARDRTWSSLSRQERAGINEEWRRRLGIEAKGSPKRTKL